MFFCLDEMCHVLRKTLTSQFFLCVFLFVRKENVAEAAKQEPLSSVAHTHGKYRNRKPRTSVC